MCQIQMLELYDPALWRTVAFTLQVKKQPSSKKQKNQLEKMNDGKTGGFHDCKKLLYLNYMSEKGWPCSG